MLSAMLAETGDLYVLGKANYNMLTSPAKEEMKISNNGLYRLIK